MPMPTDHMEPLFQNIRLKSGTRYFLYVGEVKGRCLNEFLRESLSRLSGQEVDYISIVPDVLETYPGDNFVVINPAARAESLRLGQKVSCRIPGRDFATAVSMHPRVIELVQSLLAQQGEVLLSIFEARPEMTLVRFPGVRLLGPESRIAHTWNSKLHMYRALLGQIPIPDFRTCSSRKELLETTRRLWRQWADGLFVSLEYSAAGAFSFRAASEEELITRLGDWRPPYLVARFIPHDFDPTVLGVVANAKDVYVAAIADQQMVNINRFVGSVYPSILPPEIQRRLKELTVAVGRVMGRAGYRGIFGCDYIVNRQGDLFFVEVNARKQGTTMEMCCTLENSLPEGCANLLELEYFAVTEHRFPATARELQGNPRQIHWGTYNHKVAADVWTRQRLPQPEPERYLFRRVAEEPAAGAEHLVIEHVGADFLVKAGTFLGRVVAVGGSRSEIFKSLAEGKATLEGTIRTEVDHGA